MTLKDGTQFVHGMTVYWPYKAYDTHDKARWTVDTYTDCEALDIRRLKAKHGAIIYANGVYGSAAAAAQFIVSTLERELEDTTVHLQQQLDKWGTALYDLRARESEYPCADVALFARKYVAHHLGITAAPRDDESYCHRCHSHVCLTKDFQAVALAMDETIEIFRPLVSEGWRVDSEYDGHWLRLYLYSQLGEIP